MSPDTFTASSQPWDLIEIGQTVAILLATLFSGYTALFGAKQSQTLAHRLKVKSLATGLNAEIQLFTEMVEKRRQEDWVVVQIGRLRGGLPVDRPGFIRADEQPMEPFVFFHAQMTEIGVLGPTLGADVARWYQQVSMVRATLIDWAGGRYDRMPHGDFALVLNDDLELWRETKGLAATLDADLRAAAASGLTPNTSRS